MSSDRLQNVPHDAPGTGLAVASTVEPWHDADWQRLWLAVEARPWRTLAILPAGEGASPDFTPFIAMALSRTGMVHLGSPVQVADATHVPLNQLTAFFGEVERSTRTGGRLLVALPATATSAITVSIAQASDAALLCILVGKMSSRAARNTVKQIGAPRFVGSAMFHPHQVPGTK